LQVTNNSFITLLFTLKADSIHGEIIDKANQENPLRFNFDSNDVSNIFSDKLLGKELGARFSFTIEAKNAFGEVEQENVVEIPRGNFHFNNKTHEAQVLQVGNYVPMEDEGEEISEAKIVSFNDEFVTLDFNHPLAGKNLFMEGEILNIENNTQHI
jgi:FKBP-type peptidyl-prolyl cis-trans isomerase SlyD